MNPLILSTATQQTKVSLKLDKENLSNRPQKEAINMGGGTCKNERNLQLNGHYYGTRVDVATDSGKVSLSEVVDTVPIPMGRRWLG